MLICRNSFPIRTLPSVKELHLIGPEMRRYFKRTQAFGLCRLYCRYGISPSPKNCIFNFSARCSNEHRAQFRFIAYIMSKNYSMISATTPEPTVRPPSRIANLRPFSQAMGEISSTFMLTLSPGRHISTSAGRLITPVTSVVLK